MFCRNCGENIPVDSVFCPNCGKNLLEVGERQKPVEAEASGQDPESLPEMERPRRRRRAMPVEEDVLPDAGTEDPIESPRGRLMPEIHLHWDRIGLGRILWVMGLLFGVVGFVVGLAGSIQEAIVWILFGLLLIVAGPHAPVPAEPPAERTPETVEEPPQNTSEQEMRD